MFIITTKTKLLTISVLVLAILITYNVKQSYTELEARKNIEIQEALKPSKIEIQKEELINLESEWKKAEMSIKAFEEKLDELRNEKLEIEPKIRDKRNEILGK